MLTKAESEYLSAFMLSHCSPLQQKYWLHISSQQNDRQTGTEKRKCPYHCLPHYGISLSVVEQSIKVLIACTACTEKPRPNYTHTHTTQSCDAYLSHLKWLPSDTDFIFITGIYTITAVILIHWCTMWHWIYLLRRYFHSPTQYRLN